MGWFIVNILVPLGVPAMFMALAKLIPLPPVIKARTRLMILVQDGQLGWVALGYATSCAYDGTIYLVKVGAQAVFWAAPCLALAILLIVVSGFMAALGALFPYDNTQAPPSSFRIALKQYSTFVGTLVATIFTIVLYVMVHFKLPASM